MESCCDKLDATLLAALREAVERNTPSCCSVEKETVLELCAESIVYGLEFPDAPVKEAKALCESLLDSMWSDLSEAQQKAIVAITARVTALSLFTGLLTEAVTEVTKTEEKTTETVDIQI